MIKRFFILISLCFFASCVPNKDLIYLQGDPISKKDVYKLNDEPYRLQVGDVISVDIKAKNEESVALFLKNSNAVNQGYSVDRNGNIRFPQIGEINVLGYTPTEVRIKLEKELLKYLHEMDDFFVTVSLAGIKFTIFGEITSPGTRVINQDKVNIMEAISNSGDITVTGNRKTVEVWRSTASGQKKYIIDLTKATAFDSEIYYIQPNDMIYIVPLKQKAWGTGTTGLQSLSTFVSIFTIVTSTILLIKNL